ncbi:hypothetical protein [Streptomyces sp. NPDC003077]|uniref:hypothetical protein n=1 Tax=Streptomyces sp. NPDC003077 TaxID=3154443 RepID=UPI0033A1B146
MTTRTVRAGRVTREPTPGDAYARRANGDGAPPRWVVRAAHLAALTPLPSSLWRIAGAVGVPLGFTGDSDLAHVRFGSPFSLYMIALSLLADGLGLLTLGLVRRWGEVVPRWLPLIGGRRVPPWAAVVPAGLGAAVLTFMGAAGVFGWNDPGNMGAPTSPTGTAYWVMTACYAPLVAWGPLLGIVTVAYGVRRRAADGRKPAPAW